VYPELGGSAEKPVIIDDGYLWIMKHMRSLLSSVRRAKPLSGFVLICLVCFTFGCGDRGDTKVVDFQKSAVRPGNQPSKYRPLRIAVGAMISPRETFVHYRQILNYLGHHLGEEVQLVQRKTYGEINELLGKGEIDLAFICSGPYVCGREKYDFDLMAAPEVQNSGFFYHSYLIVSQESPFQSLEDLKGKVFAFTDPESNTGKLVPTFWVTRMGQRPETFFAKTIYTHSHDNSILAVARGLVDGAAVHGLIWEYYARRKPAFTSKTRVIRKSEPYGNPPLVASKYLAPDRKGSIRRVILSMHLNPDGQKILRELMIDRFIPPKDEWYESIRKMEQQIALLESKTDALAKP
jgi:phosphonate transport system substrate-binding protein